MVTAKSLVQDLPVHLKYQYKILAKTLVNPLESIDGRVITELGRMIADIKQYGNKVLGTYRGKNWEMIRPFGTYWCGYILDLGNINDDLFAKLEENSHHGITCGSPLGFDCTHIGDFASLFMAVDEATYKDYDYVLDVHAKPAHHHFHDLKDREIDDVLKRLIDIIVEYEDS